ncbi:uncharacterized protein ASCRUDRAFT_69196 [Ascoidea rubescens DSM 1968]|uniref:Uncharacterized protein n=1 Tax=Ascoidea rubescens DSM 1968 TaxID=1344418 RepID=A0A1D2VLC5_9ASCO|nr:hypothetical protein ASCRUDRAFT_69196 [Ascoidea rubescens DSM 1968]ODV62383.1 hypothetical protein ASCRUDRAFT_69196 [Ascoidea rubescens DSM 1968]
MLLSPARAVCYKYPAVDVPAVGHHNCVFDLGRIQSQVDTYNSAKQPLSPQAIKLRTTTAISQKETALLIYSSTAMLHNNINTLLLISLTSIHTAASLELQKRACSVTDSTNYYNELQSALNNTLCVSDSDSYETDCLCNYSNYQFWNYYYTYYSCNDIFNINDVNEFKASYCGFESTDLTDQATATQSSTIPSSSSLTFSSSLSSSLSSPAETEVQTHKFCSNEDYDFYYNKFESTVNSSNCGYGSNGSIYIGAYSCICDLSDDQYWNSYYNVIVCSTDKFSNVSQVKDSICSNYTVSNSTLDVYNSSSNSLGSCSLTDYNTYLNDYIDAVNSSDCLTGLYDDDLPVFKTKCVCDLSNDEFWHQYYSLINCDNNYDSKNFTLFKSNICGSQNISISCSSSETQYHYSLMINQLNQSNCYSIDSTTGSYNINLDCICNSNNNEFWYHYFDYYSCISSNTDFQYDDYEYFKEDQCDLEITQSSIEDYSTEEFSSSSSSSSSSFSFSIKSLNSSSTYSDIEKTLTRTLTETPSNGVSLTIETLSFAHSSSSEDIAFANTFKLPNSLTIIFSTFILLFI